MKANIYIRMSLLNVELGDELDPALYNKSRWRTRWGHFQRAPEDGAGFSEPPFVAAARAHLQALLDKQGAGALAGNVEIVREELPPGIE